MESIFSGPGRADPEAGRGLLGAFEGPEREALGKTTLVRRLLALDATYARVERGQTIFRQSAADRGTPVSCPGSCGTCCLHFVPDTMPIEADRLAFHLLTEREDLIDHFFRTKKAAEARDAACPFWDPENLGKNCMVYPARPLICRLFGFCSVTDKNGEPAFSLCGQMPALSGTERRSFSGYSFMKGLFGEIPPPMADFSMEIVGLDPQGAGRRASVCDTLPLSLSKVSLLLRLAKSR